MNKQLIFMAVATLLGTFGVFLWTPTVGVVMYFTFAVMRPQYIWQWSLPPGVAWSWYVAMAVLLAAAGHLLSGARVPFAGVHRLMFAFAIWIGLTTFTARNVAVAWPWSIEYLKIFLMFFASSLFLTTPRSITAVYAAVALSLGYIAYEVNFLYLAYHYLGIYRNGYGGLDNNGAGLMLAMGLPLCYFAWQAFRGWPRWLFAALVPVLMHAVMMTYSRGAMLSVMLVLPLILLRTRSRSTAIGIVIALAILVPLLAGDQIRERFSTTAEYSIDKSAQSRFASWTAAFRMACDNPVTGVGVRNANLFSYLYGADMEGRTIHSQYLQLAADNGFMGLGLYLALLFVTWRSLVAARAEFLGRDDPAAQQQAQLISGLEASLAIFAIGSVFLSLEVFELPYVLILLAAQARDLSLAPVPEAEATAPPEAVPASA